MEKYPYYIHQYLSIEKAKEFLKSLNLRLDNPEKFNDPFEFLPATKFSKEIVLKNYNVTSSKVIQNAFKISILDTLFEIPEALTRLSQVNLVKKFNQIISDYRISCFSEVDDSILMWGHYSRQHTGIVISFSSAMDYWENNLFKVNYSKNRVKVSSFDSIFTDNETIVSEQWQRDLLITKYECWSYEKEWRFIKSKKTCLEDNKGSYLPIDKNAIKNIVFGCRISEDDRNSIINLINDWNFGVSLYQAYPDERQFAILKERL